MTQTKSNICDPRLRCWGWNRELLHNAKRLRPYIEKAAESLDDSDALNAVELYPEWKPNMEYMIGQRLKYDSTLYRVLQTHTSQQTWTPDVAPSLFALVLIPDPDAIPEWVQPDSTNPYMTGDKVTHNGTTWVSTIDNNVWEPGVYGWEGV